MDFFKNWIDHATNILLIEVGLFFVIAILYLKLLVVTEKAFGEKTSKAIENIFGGIILYSLGAGVLYACLS